MVSDLLDGPTSRPQSPWPSPGRECHYDCADKWNCHLGRRPETGYYHGRPTSDMTSHHDGSGSNKTWSCLARSKCENSGQSRPWNRHHNWTPADCIWW